MRIFTSAVFLLVVAVTPVDQTPWEQYLANPTPQNAEGVTKMEYSPGRAPQGGYDADDIQVLENQVLAGDAAAFQLAFRLYRQSDGGLAEDLGVLIGKSIRVNPAFFLRQVLASNHRCRDFSWIVRAPGLEYSDRPIAVKYEMHARRAALVSVREQSLAKVRRECLALLPAPPN